MPWNCFECKEQVDDGFVACWHCGTSREGRIDPEFEHADSIEPPIPEERPQFRLAGLFKIVTALCFAFGLVGIVASRRWTFWNSIIVIAGLAALGLLVALFVAWSYAALARRLQREIRA